MATHTKENYLKALYYLHQKEEKISISALSKKMNVSAPTVNSMVKKLQKKDWVIYEKYRPLLLTEKGKKEAALIVRKHRLMEIFLVKFMNFGWEEVHEIAEEIEHLKVDKFFDRIDELLDYPSIDPHGSPIPNKLGVITPQKYTPLSLIKINSPVKLSELATSSKELLLFLNKKEISLGTILKVIKKESFDKSITIAYNNGLQTMLSHEVSQLLLVSFC